MQTIFTTLILIFVLSSATAQTLLVSQAIITTETEVRSTDDSVDTAPKLVNNGKLSVLAVRSDDPAEMKSTTWYKGQMLKTVTTNGIKTITTIRDNAQQKTTIVTEKGNKAVGYYFFDSQLPNVGPSKDSLVASPRVKIFYQDVDRAIAGFACKRAVVDITDEYGITERAIVWYNTMVKLPDLSVTGDPGFGYLRLKPNAKMFFFEQLKGFPMEYEMALGPGRTLSVTVTRMDIQKDIKDKTFKVPNGINIDLLKIRPAN
jgi:hypothetical protein